MIYKKNTWVRIHRVVLKPNERSENLPEDTKKVPLEMWVKGYLQAEAKLGDWVSIKTVTGRNEEGKLIEAYPAYRHNYGDFVPEILEINNIVKRTLNDDE